MLVGRSKGRGGTGEAAGARGMRGEWEVAGGDGGVARRLGRVCARARGAWGMKCAERRDDIHTATATCHASMGQDWWGPASGRLLSAQD